MIEKLRKAYPSMLIYNEGNDNINPEYKWFVTDDKKIIGIHESELTTKDSFVLSAFLSPYNTTFPPLTDEEQKWSNAIHATESNSNNELQIDDPYRFVYFSINKNQITPRLFKEAIGELFTKQVPILWTNDHEGILIEEQAAHEESISYEQIIDILMSDLYVKIHFFVGPFKAGLEDVGEHYHFVLRAAKTVFNYSSKKVVTYIDAVPYLLIDRTELNVRRDMSKTILQEYIDDDETLKMIEAFVQCNLNISETAKVLHMHRNSLQYRLDRFYENIGTDIRQFHHAMTVYLALLARK